MSAQASLFDLIDKPAPSFDWTAPAVDAAMLALIEAEGRSPFGSDDGQDDAQVQSVADETMNGLVVELLSAASIDRMLALGRRGFRNSKAWELFQQHAPSTRQAAMEMYEATLDAVLEVWGFAGREAFDIEARRRAAELKGP